MSLTRMRVWRSLVTFIVLSPLAAADNSPQRRSQSTEPLNVPCQVRLGGRTPCGLAGNCFEQPTISLCREQERTPHIEMCSRRSRRAVRFAQQNFGIVGNQEIGHGSDFLVALFAIEGAGLVIEVRHAGEQIVCPREGLRFDMG